MVFWEQKLEHLVGRQNAVQGASFSRAGNQVTQNPEPDEFLAKTFMLNAQRHPSTL